ncbi:VOC family protein [Herbinix luporum]|uniref:VOC family protein n=1 Tax=Herbinix luporum TaxID=1679721 RepID=UPI0023F27200|nr:VOC family protein [Herbinix luporum]
MKIHHIGYLVEDINTATEEFQELGYTLKNQVIYDNTRKIYISFLTNNNYLIELIQPTEESPGLSKMLKKNGSMPYHICYETDNLENSIQSLQKKGYFLIQPCAIAPALNNKKVAFLMNTSVGIIELVEIGKE